MDSSEGFRRRNFASAKYLDEQKKSREMVEITHDGFAFLVMGFTGKKAAQWKEDFLDAFGAMARQLSTYMERKSNALNTLRPPWEIIAQNNHLSRKQLIELTGHKSPGSITACRRRMRQVGLID